MRYADWQARFWAEMERQRVASFVWGERDCILYAATVADAVSVDGDYVKRARKAFHWKNAKEAVALLATADLQSLVETVMGPMVAWTRLGMADFVLVVDDNDRQSLAIHDGTHVFGPIDPGMQRVPFHNVKGGWLVT